MTFFFRYIGHALAFVAIPLVATSETLQEPVEMQEPSFQIHLTEEQSSAIHEIVTTLGQTSLLSLGFKKSHLKSLGDKLKGIGSLQFLGYIFTHTELKSLMREIQKSSVKWDGLLSGIKPGLEREANSQELFPKLRPFAKALNADYDKLLAEANNHNWDGFVQVLIDTP